MSSLPSAPDRPLLAALASAGTAGSAADPAEVELFRLTLGGEAFAIQSGLVHEVVRTPPITPLPGAPPFLIGVAAHRGEVVAVVDLARLLGRGQTQLSGRSRMAIARWDGMIAGLLADQVSGLAKFPSAALQATPLGAEQADLILGVVAGDPRLHVLDLRRALSAARARAMARS